MHSECASSRAARTFSNSFLDTAAIRFSLFLPPTSEVEIEHRYLTFSAKQKNRQLLGPAVRFL